MRAPLFTARDLADLRVLEGSALLVRAVGGTDWSVTRSVGDGVSGPATSSAQPAITGEVTQGADTRLSGTAPATAVGDAPWVLSLWSGTVQADDVIASVATPTWRFRVMARAADFLHPTWLLEQL